MTNQEIAYSAPGVGNRDGEAPRVLRSLLSPPALAAAIGQAYALEPTGCMLLRSFTNDIYQVDTTGGTFVAKVYGPGWRTASDIAYEIDLLDHLDAHGVGVALAASRVDGRRVHTLAMPEGDRYCVLFRYAPGAEPEEPFTPALYRQFGDAAAAMHHTADSFVTSHPRARLDLPHLLDRSLTAIRPCLRHRPDDWDYLQTLAERVRVRMAEFEIAGLDWGPCHGDLTLDCFRVADDGRITFYDFDSGGPGWRALEFQGMYSHAPRANWDAFRTSYTSVRRLSDADLAAVPWCVPLYAISHMGWAARDWATWSGRWRVDDDFWNKQLRWLQGWESANLDQL